MGTSGEMPELRLYFGEQRRKRRQVTAISLVVGLFLGWFSKEPLTDAWRQINEPRHITKEMNDGLPADSQETSAPLPRVGERGDLVEGTSTPEIPASVSSTDAESAQPSEHAATIQQAAESSDINSSGDVTSSQDEPAVSDAKAAADLMPAAGDPDSALPTAIVDADRLNMRAGQTLHLP